MLYPIQNNVRNQLDLSGIWENFRKPGDAPVRSVNAQFFDDLPSSLINEFRDIGNGVAGGLPLQPWAATLKQQRMTENSKDNPDAHCLPLGLMQLHTHPDPRRIVQTPSLIVVVYEANYGLRQIYLDGRPAPATCARSRRRRRRDGAGDPPPGSGGRRRGRHGPCPATRAAGAR